MLTRRSFAAALVGAATARGAGERPNVLSISVDDMNDWVGCLGGYPGVRTPNIDALARRGVLFRDAHCSSPVCNPSRTALMTGKRPSTTGVYRNNQYWRPAHPDIKTLPMFFRENGYHAAGAGKIFHHVAGFNPPDQWDDFQIQEFDDPWYRRLSYYPWIKKIPNPPGHPFNGMAGDNFAGEFDWGVLPNRPERTYGDMAAVRYGQEFLKREHDKPFFLAVGLWHPHIPLFAPQNYFDLYPKEEVRLPEVPGNDLDDIPPIAQKWAAVRRAEHERILREGKWTDGVQAYLACISFADAMVGYVLRALEESRYAENTIVVFWSDHGWHLGEKRHWHKSTLWQRSTHVPMIWAGPGVHHAGLDRKQPVELLDIYPTLADLCGLPKAHDLEGASLTPQLRDAGAKRRPAVTTYLPDNHAVVTEKWRYIRYADGTDELYDRVNDPNEWDNLAGEPRYAFLKQRLAYWMPETSVPEVPGRDAYDFDFDSYTWTKK
ncbi:MAG: sulfatase [Bryobacterales bacterium]|nr:sulfatase [Bryobacterales bacterium]MDE0294347.1 sulfatase [Bryobacterales bacterium]